MKDWKRKAAKRMLAEEALKLAVAEVAKAPQGASTYQTPHYAIARHLAQHAADQLRLSEGGD